MIKTAFITILLILSLAYQSDAQNYSITITPPEPYAWEGSTVSYMVTFSGNVPQDAVFEPSVVNGSVLSYNLSPYSQSYIVVHWNCRISTATISITEYIDKSGTVVKTYNPVIWTYSNAANFCNTAAPAFQTLQISQQPASVNISNCTPFCTSSYNFQYRWEVGDVPIGANPQVPPYFYQIQGATGDTYQPPTSTVPAIKAYRRITTFFENGNTYEYASNWSVVTFLGPLLGGSISGSGYVYANNVPVISEYGASGGNCNYNYSYSWEKSENNGPWLTIYPGQSFPNYTISSNTSFRRRVDCGNDIAYTNVLSFTIASALSPGVLSVQPDLPPLTYNSIPTINQTSATGGLCAPASYEYTWERSVSNGPWQIIYKGSTAAYPSNVGIIGNSRFRRKVSCSGEELYTNIVSFTMLPYTSPNAENLNYVRVNNILIPDINNWPQSDNLQTGDKLQSTTYFDGLGRAVQTVGKETSEVSAGVWADMTAIYEYDAAGRSDKSYLPYSSSSNIGKFKTNAKTEQNNWIHTTFSEAANAPTYSQVTFENSPLSRVLSVQQPGEGWMGITSNTQYEFNTAAEHIKIWQIDFAETSVPYVDGEYADGKLFKLVSIDEKGKKVYEYSDFTGNVVLKKVQKDNTISDYTNTGWLTTYYVYDNLNQLRATITPRAVNYLEQSSWVFSNATVYKELCFYEHFDERGRTIIKHSAGAGEIHLVYDNRDRLILSQDEKQRNKSTSTSQWLFHLYDKENREIVSGLFENTKTIKRPEYESYANTSMNNDELQLTIFTGQNESIKVHNPVAGNSSLGLGCTNIIINTVSYFDNYNYPQIKQFIAGLTFPSTSNPYVEPLQKSERVLGMSTGGKVRVLDAGYDDNNTANDKYLTSTVYYDERGRNIEGLTDNIKGNTDYAAIQYDFSGKTLGITERQKFNANNFSKYVTTTQFEYNKIGQITSILKKYPNQTTYKRMVNYTYDALGRIKSKKLSPDFGATGLEILNYDYNVNGLLTGINKDYALSGSSLAQWDHYFGMYLGYDNKDTKFSASRHDGLITGIIWKSRGDNNPRKYNYEYDDAGRLTAANFSQKEKPTDASWTTTYADFSMTNVTYDDNGNLLTMNHKGIVPGIANPVFTDKLEYTYSFTGAGSWTNKLERVYDNAPGLGSQNNGLLGDFKDETYGSNTHDYDYDENGNLVIDNNKKIRVGSNSGIEYNYMDKPQVVTIEGKSKTEFIYDATGDKIGKKVTDLVANTVTSTWYNGGYVYEETSASLLLQFISNEEGRVRVYLPSTSPQPRLTLGNNIDLPDGYKGVFEFFVKDNLQSTRAVLSEETHSEWNNCTMEISEQAYEELMFQDNNTQQVVSTRTYRSNDPVIENWITTGSAAPSMGNAASKLDPGHRIGPNLMLKVMAGDQLVLKTDYFYNQPAGSTGGNFTNTLVDVIKDLLNGTTSQGTGAVKGNAIDIRNNLSNSGGGLYNFIQNQSNGTSTIPKAYLNYLFFDENFKFVEYDPVTSLGSYAQQVTSSGDGQGIILPNVKVPKNGYVLVYVSNNSNSNVYFDNLDVTHIRGALVEDNAYYPYGLKIKGISARAYNKLDNNYGFQGDYAEEDEETGWDEFDLRMYNPQIGRWNGVDPYDEFASPYLGMGANPANFSDPSGGGVEGLIGAGIGLVTGGISSYLIGKNNGVTGWKLAGLTTGGALAGAGVGYGLGEHFFGNEAPFFANVRSFYAGLFGDNTVYYKNGTIGEHFIGTYSNCPVTEALDGPHLWDWLVNIQLAGWFDSEIPGIEIIQIQYVSTSGLFEDGDLSMSYNKTETGSVPRGPDGTSGTTVLGGSTYQETDQITVNLRRPPSGETYETTISGGVRSPNDVVLFRLFPNPNVNVNPPNKVIINGTSVTITVTQTTGTVTLQNNVTNSKNTVRQKKQESRFKIKTIKRIKKPIKRFRLFGITIPFLKKSA